MLTLDDYLADQLHNPDFRTHFINEMAEHVRDGSICLSDAIEPIKAYISMSDFKKLLKSLI